MRVVVASSQLLVHKLLSYFVVGIVLIVYNIDMKKIKVLGAVLFCLLSSVIFVGCDFGAGNANNGDMTWVIKSNYNNVVSVVARFGGVESRGTGVLIREGGYIATNAHVITRTTPGIMGPNHEVSREIKIEFWTDDHYNGNHTNGADYTITLTPNYNVANGTDPNSRILYWNINEDLAILKCVTDDMPNDYKNKSAVIRNSAPDASPLKMGEPIAALGYASGKYYLCTVGVVTMVYGDGLNAFKGETEENGALVEKNIEYAILHDATIIPGNSGGPVFDSSGKCIGLNTLVISNQITSGELYVALSSRTILSKMAALGIL